MSEMKKNQAGAVDAELLAADADAALSAIDRAGGRAQALVEAWVKQGNAAAVSRVAELGTGAARKAARRGLNVLRSRGIKLDAPPRVASLTTSAGSGVAHEAWLIPPDPSGTVLIVIAARAVARRAESAFFYLHESAGVRNVSVGELSGSRLKEALKRAGHAGLEPVSVPVEYARWRVTEARKELKTRGLPEPLGMGTAEPLLLPVPEPQSHPLDAEGLALSEEDVKEFAARSGTLHALPEFRSWMPPREAVDALLAEIGKQLPQGETPDPEVVSKALTEAIDAATDRYFVPERRTGLVRLLKDSALSVLSTQGDVRALEVVAAIQRIETAGLITDPPHEVPFLRFFFEKAVATLAFQGGGRLQVPVPGPSEETAPAVP